MTDAERRDHQRPTRSPVELGASTLPSYGLEARDLIACQWPGHGVVVVARGDRGSCTSPRLAAVPPSYARARRRAVRLETLAMEFERGAGCLAPREFARRMTAELRSGGWRRWRAVVGGGRGSCGRVSVPNGFRLLGSIGSSVDATRRTITIKGRASIELEQVIYGVDSPGVRLFDSSGARCFTLAALEERVRSSLAAAKVPIRFRHGSMPANQGIEQPRGARYAEGCAIFVGAHPAFPGERTEIVVELWQRDVAG